VSRSLLLGIITYSLVVAAMLTVRGELITLALPLVAYLLAALLFVPDDIHLEATRHVSNERVSPNADVDISVTITNLGASLDEVLIEDHVPAGLRTGSGHSRHLIRLAKGESYSFTYSVSGPRGGYVFKNVQAQINASMGAISREVQLDAPGQLFVFPPVTRLRHVAIHPRRTRVYAGSIPARAGGSGAEFFGVRGYQPGDSPRTINWRASAHSIEQLYSNEFQQERVADVGIVLDGRTRTNMFAHGHSLFEHSVGAAAALADAMLFQGNRVGLLLYASYLSWTIAGYGRVQRERILHSLAQAKPGGSDVFSDLDHFPTRLFPPESQIILVSPLVDDDLPSLIGLRAHGYQVLVISPDPIKFELSYLPKNEDVNLAARVIRMERMLLLQKVQRAGIQILDWDVHDPFDQVVKQTLSRPPAWLRAVGR